MPVSCRACEDLSLAGYYLFAARTLTRSVVIEPAFSSVSSSVVETGATSINSVSSVSVPAALILEHVSMLPSVMVQLVPETLVLIVAEPDRLIPLATSTDVRLPVTEIGVQVHFELDETIQVRYPARLVSEVIIPPCT